MQAAIIFQLIRILHLAFCGLSFIFPLLSCVYVPYFLLLLPHYYCYLLQLSYHSVAIVVTLIQTKQISLM